MNEELTSQSSWIPGDKPGDIEHSSDFTMMEAYQYALEKIDTHKAYFQLSIVQGGFAKGLIQVSVTDPIAVELIRDQILSAVSGILSKKR